MGGYEGSLKFGGKLDVGRVLSSFWLASFQSSLKICSPSVNFSSADFWSRCEHLRHRFPCTDKGEVHKVHDNFRKIRRVDANVPMSTCFRQPFSWMNLNRLQNFYWFWKNLFHESFTEAVSDVSVCTYFFDGNTSTTSEELFSEGTSSLIINADVPQSGNRSAAIFALPRCRNIWWPTAAGFHGTLPVRKLNFWFELLKRQKRSAEKIICSRFYVRSLMSRIMLPSGSWNISSASRAMGAWNGLINLC